MGILFWRRVSRLGVSVAWPPIDAGTWVFEKHATLVRDAQGAEVYAWNAVLDQSVLKPGERAWFKSRLASPPPEGRNIDIRFFNKRDLAAGQA